MLTFYQGMTLIISFASLIVAAFAVYNNAKK